MKKLDAIAFDFDACRKQFDEFRPLLAAKTDLSESKDVLPFFQAREHLALLFGQFNSRIAVPDRIGWEFDIFGDFACDLVVGEWVRDEYCFVEFEDATQDSVFEKRGKKATREWGRRFEHGYSQIIDWAHKLDDRSASADFLARFGVREIKFEAVLVIGRDAHLDMGERHRLSWRTDKVLINTKKSSSPGGLHPQALAEPDVELSPHPALMTQSPVVSPSATERTDWDRDAPPDPASGLRW